MLVNPLHPYRFVCMLPPKTGTSATCHVLKKLNDEVDMAKTVLGPNRTAHPGLCWQPPHLYYPRDDELLKHSLAFGSDPIVGSDPTGYFRMTTCRNPYTRMVSIWMHMAATKLNGITFQEFLHHSHAKQAMGHHWMALPQKTWVDAAWNNVYASFGGSPEMDAILHMETLEEDIQNLPWMNPDVQVPRINTMAKVCPWWEWYQDLGDKDKVLELFSDDFELFGYDRDFNVAIEESEKCTITK